MPPRSCRRLPIHGGARLVFALAVSAALAPSLTSALEPRFDHRYEKGPMVEALYVRDVVWHGSADSETSSRGAVRASWGFDPTGDGNELFFGGTFTVLQGDADVHDPVKVVLDARYRACVGTEEFKTLLEIGLWSSIADRFAVGPLVGLGFMYDFNRNIGVFASGLLGAGIGESRVVSFGGGLGIQLRYE